MALAQPVLFESVLVCACSHEGGVGGYASKAAYWLLALCAFAHSFPYFFQLSFLFSFTPLSALQMLQRAGSGSEPVRI